MATLTGRARGTLAAHCFGVGRAAALALWTLYLLALPFHAEAEDAPYPRVLRTRYEAVDSKVGGNFIIWLEREKVWHGLDPRLYPAVKYVDVTHLTPSPGSPPITLIEIMSVNSTVPEFYHLAGIVRFKVTGMTLKSSNIPPP
jgi:hypothetical protein